MKLELLVVTLSKILYSLCMYISIDLIKIINFRAFGYALLWISILLSTSATGASPYPITYLTWQQHPESTMTIQWITPKENLNDLVEFKQMGTDTWFEATGQHHTFPDKRHLIHRVELLGLHPDSRYEFRIKQDNTIKIFRTMPEDLERPVRFVAGGDVYHDSIEILKEMNVRAAKTNPSFALVGGDLAYSIEEQTFLNRIGWGKEKCYRWLRWLAAWQETMITPDGCLIPLIPAIGNHDTMGWYNRGPNRAACFYALFPTGRDKGCHVIDFGKYMSIITLDSGHTHPIYGKQKKWLANALSNRVEIPHKFALYHVGAYPSFRNPNMKISQAIKTHWSPLFEYFGLNIAFEHHDHAYKRTHPIRNGQIDPTGVLYVGDGAWGVEKPRVPKTPAERWYLAASASARHVIVISIQRDGRLIEALDSEGKIIDSYRQDL